MPLKIPKLTMDLWYNMISFRINQYGDVMNQKDWAEYFEAINGRKPSMQEFQEAREKGSLSQSERSVDSIN